MDPLNKRDVAEHLLEKGSIIVHLDPRLATVLCPPWLKNQAQLVLQLGLSMPIPIPDLRVDDEGISGTLSFSRNPFSCFCPWGAVFAIVGDEGRGQVWPESMPAEVIADVEREQDAIEIDRFSAPPPSPKTASVSGGKTRARRPLPAGWRVIK